MIADTLTRLLSDDYCMQCDSCEGTRIARDVPPRSSGYYDDWCAVCWGPRKHLNRDIREGLEFALKASERDA